MTLDEQIGNSIRQWEKKFERYGCIGYDWFNVTGEEIEVFEIDTERLPAMLTAWSLFLCMIDVLGLGKSTFTREAIEEERKQWPDLRMQYVDEVIFSAFATKRVRITQREAHAIYHKIDFWQVRNGIVKFSDQS